MDESITVVRVRDALFVGRLDRDGAAVLLAANLRPWRERNYVVVGDSVLNDLHQLDPWLLDDIDQATPGAVALVAPGLAASGLDGSPAPAQRIADILRVEVTAPTSNTVALGDGELFVRGEGPGWVSFRFGDSPNPVGARLPAPWWQAGLPAGDDALTHVPAGLWLRRPDAPDRMDDPLYEVGVDMDRMYLVIGAPGEELPSRSAVVEALRRLPEQTRDRAVLVSYGVGPAARIAQQVADELGTPVRAAHGVPDFDGRLTYVDRTGTACWQPFALESVYRPGAVPVLDRWAAPPRLPMLEPGCYQLTAGWRVEVVPRGLAVHPDDSPLDRTMLAADTGPTADLVIGANGRLPDDVPNALDELIRNLPETARATLRILPVDEPTATALGTLEAADALVPLPSTLIHQPSSVAPPRGGLVITVDGRLVPAFEEAEPVASGPSVASAEPVGSAELAVGAKPEVEAEPMAAPIPEVSGESAAQPEPMPSVPQPARPAAPHPAPEPAPDPAAAQPATPFGTGAAGVRAEPASARTPEPPPAESGRVVTASGAEPDVESVAALLPDRTTPRFLPSVTRQPTSQPAPDLQHADTAEPAPPPQPAESGDSRGVESEPPAHATEATTTPGDAATHPIVSSPAQGMQQPTESVPEPAPEPAAGRRQVEVPEGTRSTSAQREAMRERLGTRYDRASRVVATLLSERPGLRSGGEERAAQLAELAVVRAFIDDAEGSDGQYDADFHVCLADGLRRLPTARTVVVRGIPEKTDVAPETTLRLRTPVIAAPAGAGPAGPAEALIWTTTGRRVDGLQDEPTGEVVLPGHTRLRVLAVEQAPVHRVLLAEEGAAAEPALKRLRTVAVQRNGATGPAVPRWFDALPVN